MFLIVGLGNPGLKYRKTRHNVGFMALDEFQKENNFPKFKLSKKSKAAISEGEINGQKVILAKPQTFMNRSGVAVKKIMSHTNSQASNVLVIHDDFGLPLGKMKISKGKGSGRHKGVESIIKELKTKDFVRFRIGIKPTSILPLSTSQLERANKNQKSKTSVCNTFDTVNTDRKIKNQKLKIFVLENFSQNEEKILKQVIKNACQDLRLKIEKSALAATKNFIG